MKRALVLLLLGGCVTVPKSTHVIAVGYAGPLYKGCETSLDDPLLRRDTYGIIHAEKPGIARHNGCGIFSDDTIEIRSVDHLVIDAPSNIRRGVPFKVRVQIVDDTGAPLDVGDALATVHWHSTGPVEERACELLYSHSLTRECGDLEDKFIGTASGVAELSVRFDGHEARVPIQVD